MRGIARTDRLVRLVMWGALLTVAWILFSPGKASASERPVEDVVRATTSLAGSVLGGAAQDRPTDAPGGSAAAPTDGSGSRVDRRAASSPKGAPAKEGSAKAAGSSGSPKASTGHQPRRHETGASPVRVLGGVSKSLPRNVIRNVMSETSTSGIGSGPQPVVAATTEAVRAVVDDAVETTTTTAEVLPGLDRPVRDVTDVVVDVVDALPVVGTQPVVGLPLPGLVPPSSPSPPTPSSEPPATDAGSPALPAAAEDQREDATAPARSASGPRPLTDVTAEPAFRGPLVGQVDDGWAATRPAPSTEGGATDPSLPWPADLPAPAAPAPAPSVAGGAGQPHGVDVQADLPPMTSSTSAAAAAFDGNDLRAPGALNARPGLRPD
jgi:hypothetical protein